ncbi:unnamed protein product [marine sediment metagenome]|uniref:Uncharacterized protein n=1 Tax=marine sediment metagenome TaxID=412755 RepID=X0YG82_9ZZZZ
MKCKKCGYDDCENGLGKSFPIIKFEFNKGIKRIMFNLIKKNIKVEYINICDDSDINLYGITRSVK